MMGFYIRPEECVIEKMAEDEKNIGHFSPFTMTSNLLLISNNNQLDPHYPLYVNYKDSGHLPISDYTTKWMQP